MANPTRQARRVQRNNCYVYSSEGTLVYIHLELTLMFFLEESNKDIFHAFVFPSFEPYLFKILLVNLYATWMVGG